MVTTHRDNNSFRLLVLLHTSNNPIVRVIYLFMKTCHTQLLLAPGVLVVGSQADLVRTVMGKEIRSSPHQWGGSFTEQASRAVGFIAIYLAYWNRGCYRVEAQ